MNATAALCAAFLRGEVLTIKTAFRDLGISNLPRECGRSIERKFGVRLAKVRKEGKSRFGIVCTWFEYRLPTTDYNADGRAKMEAYVKEHMGEIKSNPKNTTTVRQHTRKNPKQPQETIYTNKLF